MSGLRLFSNIIIALLTVWVSYAYVNSIIGNIIMFPLVSPRKENIPYYKLKTVRLSVFITFVYYALFHFIKGSEKIYPIHFLKTYLFALAFTGFITLFQYQDTKSTDTWLVLFFTPSAVILQIATRRRFKKYFSKK